LHVSPAGQVGEARVGSQTTLSVAPPQESRQEMIGKAPPPARFAQQVAAWPTNVGHSDESLQLRRMASAPHDCVLATHAGVSPGVTQHASSPAQWIAPQSTPTKTEASLAEESPEEASWPEELPGEESPPEELPAEESPPGEPPNEESPKEESAVPAPESPPPEPGVPS
jgi:hypothetical protein